ncbi:MAG: phosphatase PAP2 family protein [Flavobacteriaceae bacterium]|nr:phosphatase PAP2 family protein [Flavobacteriaceae bacterium]
MKRFNRLILILLILNFILYNSYAQSIQKDTIYIDKKKSVKYESLIVPTILISYGIVGLKNKGIKSVNEDIHQHISNQNFHNSNIDNYTQYIPALSVYGLNALGVKGKNNFKDRTIILGTATIIMTSTTLGLKSIAKVDRPNLGSNDSFPSGHVAKAFMGAEFLYQEYKEVSPWYGITAYIVATGTGALRIYNDKHWLTDVVTGAGIGILSTKVAYWLKPFIDNKILKSKYNLISSSIVPSYDGENIIVGMFVSF